jgi:hypothetical protein
MNLVNDESAGAGELTQFFEDPRKALTAEANITIQKLRNL